MIYGIGTDIISIQRIEAALTRHGERFAAKILSDDELQAFQQSARPAHFLAKRFAAKEAAAKAFGTGFRDGLHLRHISVTHDPLGKPGLAFSDQAELLKDRLGIGESYLSVSDEERYAVAFVTLVKSAG
jgi:holo-[acyl-carrier protein] synthase